eukprot:Gregarina_sp_Poly_1__8658@NODE_515_length_7812_cov_238_903163_g409_i0_p6_GENE_NODE_515_length_7812_cov_238_903163_g409_i0NODE_515_length_7812_cov_238_903163_g409_i0_p6_ORF_typecomplete_len115_score2_15HTH_psq/PF05225_16/74HTH_psq/PF05225_16/0_33DUF3136/PF11334_8/0_068_NODE_515_length_7812_cov_238_903163_g409_i015991943
MGSPSVLRGEDLLIDDFFRTSSSCVSTKRAEHFAAKKYVVPSLQRWSVASKNQSSTHQARKEDVPRTVLWEYLKQLSRIVQSMFETERRIVIQGSETTSPDIRLSSICPCFTYL